MSKYLIGLLAGVAGLAAGAWLIVAPFALGYQREHADWVTATKVDFITGIVLAVIALAVIALNVLATREHLLGLGVLTRRVPRAAVAAPATAAPAVAVPSGTSPSDLQALLAPLLAAMASDQQAARDGAGSANPERLAQP